MFFRRYRVRAYPNRGYNNYIVSKHRKYEDAKNSMYWDAYSDTHGEIAVFTIEMFNWKTRTWTQLISRNSKKVLKLV